MRKKKCLSFSERKSGVFSFRCVQFYGQVENLTRNCKEFCESLHALILILSVKLGPFLAPVPTNYPWSSGHDMTT